MDGKRTRREETPAPSTEKATGIYLVIFSFGAQPKVTIPKPRRLINVAVFADSAADALEKACKYYRRFAMEANKNSALKKYWAPVCARVSKPKSLGQATFLWQRDLTRREFNGEYSWNQMEDWHHMLADPDYFPTPYEEEK